MSTTTELAADSPNHRPFVARQSSVSRRPTKVASHDGRSPEAVLMRRTRQQLAAHCGGKPSATQAALINRAVMLTLQLARMDAKALDTGAMSDHATREYLAWSNTLARTMRLLGLKGTPAAPRTAADLYAEAARRSPDRAA